MDNFRVDSYPNSNKSKKGYFSLIRMIVRNWEFSKLQNYVAQDILEFF